MDRKLYWLRFFCVFLGLMAIATVFGVIEILSWIIPDMWVYAKGAITIGLLMGLLALVIHVIVDLVWGDNSAIDRDCL